MIPELKEGRCSGSIDRKRQLGSENSIKVKRMKQETEDSRSPSSATLHSDPSSVSPYAQPFLHTAQVQHIGSLSVCYPNGCKCIISYPGTDLHPLKTALWEPTWNNWIDFHLGLLHERFQRFLYSTSLFPPFTEAAGNAAAWRKGDTL